MRTFADYILSTAKLSPQRCHSCQMGTRFGSAMTSRLWSLGHLPAPWLPNNSRALGLNTLFLLQIALTCSGPPRNLLFTPQYSLFTGHILPTILLRLKGNTREIVQRGPATGDIPFTMGSNRSTDIKCRS